MKKAFKFSTETDFEIRLLFVTQAVDAHHCYLLKYLYGLTHQYQDAENLLQELWLYVLHKFDEEKIGSLPLLRRKAYQLFVDHYRHQKRRTEVLAEELPEIPIPPTPYSDASDRSERNLQQEFWMGYPSVNLTAQQKEVLWLHARYGFTYKEIEARVGVASSTIGDWIAEARQQLAAAINAEAN